MSGVGGREGACGSAGALCAGGVDSRSGGSAREAVVVWGGCGGSLASAGQNREFLCCLRTALHQRLEVEEGQGDRESLGRARFLMMMRITCVFHHMEPNRLHAYCKHTSCLLRNPRLANRPALEP